MTTIPSDKDVYQITDTVIRQTECQYTFGAESAIFSIKFKGVPADATQLASSYREGSRVSLTTLMSDFGELSSISTSGLASTGKVASSRAQTQKGVAVTTIAISFPYSNKLTGGGSGSGPDQTKLVTWSERSTKYQFPLDVYSGDAEPDDLSAGCAAAVAAWKNMKDTNAELYKNFQYYLSSEEDVQDLSGRSLDIAKKLYAGIETVERAYPEIIRRTAYANIHSTLSSADDAIGKIEEKPNLYYIDDASVSGVWNDLFPNTSWLKTGFDVESEATEYEDYWNVTVTEAWTGISKVERGPWDKNLYGPDGDRWKFFTGISAQ